MEESLSFADSLDLESMQITVGIRIYPGTPLAERALEEGIVAPGDNFLAPRFLHNARTRKEHKSQRGTVRGKKAELDCLRRKCKPSLNEGPRLVNCSSL